ncbi:MAG: TonB-dependent receptor plug domain-containing protein [Tannerella sp.]|jgi:TonB-dependent SusC/RagA subfamily outer membrane receptor|nr:TonB-dependent receptor plug domain-containing protein [Tannerella sp.]
MKKTKFSALILSLLLSIGGLSAQSIDVKVKVTDKKGEPVSGAVVTYGKKQGLVTDANGELTINKKNAGNKITVSYLGFKQQEINLNNDESEILTIVLEEDPKELVDVVVIGYGKTSKRKATGTVSTITRETLEQYPGTNLQEILQGRVAGLALTRTSGLPGSNSSINIRGVNTLSDDSGGGHACCGGGAPTPTNTEPLIVIDGVPFINQSISPLDIGAVGEIGPLASLSTADIERIDVLRDSDATAIYGSRGANGVILITTKSTLED